MLTVRLIDPSGYEIVKEVRSVIYTPGVNVGPAHVTIFNVNPANTEDINSGTVYVMNDNGKTVADYFLGEPINEVTGG